MAVYVDDMRASYGRMKMCHMIADTTDEILADGVETFEEAFLAHIVMPDGLSVADHVAPRIAELEGEVTKLRAALDAADRSLSERGFSHDY